MSFLRLPTELLINVGSYIAEPELKSLARTSRRLHGVFDGILYHSAKSNESVRCVRLPPRAGILRAARAENYEAVRKFIQIGTNLNTQHPTSLKTALYMAVTAGHLAMAEALLENGADIAILSSRGLTALDEAAKCDIVDPTKRFTLEAKAEPRSTPMLELLLRYEPDTRTIVNVFSHDSGIPRITGRLLRKAALSRPDGPAKAQVEFVTFLITAAVDGDLDDMLLLIRWLEKKNDLSWRSCSSRYLSAAAMTGNTAFVEALLQAGCDPNAMDRYMTPPLYFALLLGDINMARCLLDHGAYLIYPDDDDWASLTPPECGAAASNDMAVLDFVLGLGADPVKVPHILHSTICRKTLVPCILADPISFRPFSGQMFRRLIEMGAEINAPDNVSDIGLSPLQNAVKFDEIEAVRILLEHGAEVGSSGQLTPTPLHMATETGLTDIMDLLLQHGADPHLAGEDMEGAKPPPLVNAQSAKAVALLLKYGANVRGPDHGPQPLSVAAETGNLEVLAALLDAGAPLYSPDEDGHYPFHNALASPSKTPKAAIIKMFLEHGVPANTKASGPCRGEPLCHAIMPPGIDLEAARLLLEHGANIHSVTPDGQNCIHDACIFRHLPTVRLLLEYGADVTQKTRDGRTPLHLAVARNSSDVVSLLLEHNAPVNEQSPCGKTALHVAVEKKSEKMVTMLLGHGASPHIGKHNETSTLHTAISRNVTGIASMLLEHGAVDINGKNRKGMTPLMLAAMYGREDVVSILLDRGAELRHTDRDGQMAIELAYKHKHETITKKLRKADPEAATIGHCSSFHPTVYNAAKVSR